ncbi:MAG: cyclic nucleotide-binding domain-containing protein [Nitrospirae bacterium]|nr:cyclic nucleotide-binding domain-containing protein [Nitrospirota bacterium]
MATDYRDLKKYCYFSHLSDSALKAVAARLHTVEFPAGTEIIREDAAADAFYLVKEGEVEIFKKTQWGQKAKLSVISHGKGFGEMALLTCSPRCCSVTAKTDVRLLALMKADFEEIVRLDSAFSMLAEKRVKSYEQYNRMKTLQPFALLEPEKMAAVLDKLEERSFRAGEDIVVEGAKGDLYFIVKSGCVEVIKKNLDGKAERVAVLREGQGFGEEALITGAPRSATVRASDDVIVWTLSQDAFLDVMRSAFLEEISSEDVLKNEHPSYLDVRMQMEVAEERIPRSVHIPLDELRGRYQELDGAKEYYVYCLLGARSAIAAFLLNSRGIKARSIKGGLLNWTGPVEGRSEGVHTPFKPT